MGRRSKNSRFIRPLAYGLDLAIIIATAFWFPLELRFFEPLLFYAYIAVIWVVIAVWNGYYEIYRFTKMSSIVTLIIRQFAIFFLALYSFIGFFKEQELSRLHLGLYCVTLFLLIVLIKFTFRYFLVKYRITFGRNMRRVIVLGNNDKTRHLIEVFQLKDEFGYEFKKQFNKVNGEFDLPSIYKYVEQEDIDEIYCSLADLSNQQAEELIDFTDVKIKKLKFIPDNKNLFTKRMKFEYYDLLPILSLRNFPLENRLNSFGKRVFDIVFASLVIILLLSWLMPIIGLLIVLDSPGPIYFRQSRPGLNEEGFYCYKFRTMRTNDSTEVSASRDDPRVTRLGAFLRRTSIDELPQFINVLFGQMSVVGPRPHLWSQNERYGERIKSYMVRHYVKPGITGLAQSKGFRGGIESNEDIVNRIRYDIFYIENWSLFLDIRIIFQTALNVFREEENAY